MKHKPNRAGNRDRNQNDDENTPGFQSPMGCFQPQKTDNNEQDRSKEEQENTHAVRMDEKLN